LQLLRDIVQLRGRGKIALACLLALLVGVVGLLASSHELHHHVCTGSDAQEHQCAATLFAHGLVEAMDSAGFSHFIAGLAQTISPAARPELPSVEYLLLPGRAPPVVFS
jgi:hypothetical protein